MDDEEAPSEADQLVEETPQQSPGGGFEHVMSGLRGVIDGLARNIERTGGDFAHATK